uniref:Uncharacterized protein n=1 Tax=Strongyloides venezuelensis TaxID=75913 RepID=A0A0K0FE29_STRVS
MYSIAFSSLIINIFSIQISIFLIFFEDIFYFSEKIDSPYIIIAIQMRRTFMSINQRTIYCISSFSEEDKLKFFFPRKREQYLFRARSFFKIIND